MGKATGFIEFEREKQPYRKVEERLQDWNQVMQAWPVEPLKTQASRCMDCGIPFCHQGLSARELDSGLERPGLSRPVDGSDSKTSRH